MEDHLALIKNSIIQGRHLEIEKLVEEAIGEDLDLNELINNSMIGAMDVVGERFESGEIFVPEMLAAAHTMKKGLEIIKPLLPEEEKGSQDVIVLCTVKGDIHDIGKNLVSIMLEGAGFEVLDLGVDIVVDDVIRKVEEIKPPVLGLSALLTTTMQEMGNVIHGLDRRGLRESVKVMVGGAPVSETFAEEIGADAYGKDAVEAVNLSKKWTV